MSLQTVRRFVLIASSLLLSVPAFAHHSYTQFEPSKLTLTGTVKEFQWTNPHIWIIVQVPEANGQVTEWGIESASPNMLKQNGWRPKMFEPGEKVTAIVHPKKDGSKASSLIQITKADGSVVTVMDMVLRSLNPDAPPPGGPPTLGPEAGIPPGPPPASSPPNTKPGNPDQQGALIKVR